MEERLGKMLEERIEGRWPEMAGQLEGELGAAHRAGEEKRMGNRATWRG
jgi:hypothetical protein